MSRKIPHTLVIHKAAKGVEEIPELRIDIVAPMDDLPPARRCDSKRVKVAEQEGKALALDLYHYLPAMTLDVLIRELNRVMQEGA